MSILTATQDVRLQIRDYLRSMNIGQRRITTALNLSKTHVSEMLNAKRTLSAEHLQKINDELGTNFGEMPPPPQMTMAATG